MNNSLSSYHPLVSDIITLLQNKQCWFETFEHEEVRTSEEAAKVRTGYTIAQGAKAIIIRVKKAGQSNFVMCVIPGNQRFDNEKVKNAVETKDIRFATPDEVGKISNGVLPGGVPPFGNLFNIPVYVDISLLENERIIFNAGDRRFSIAMKSSDWEILVEPIRASII